jgi:hypothetical protein
MTMKNRIVKYLLTIALFVIIGATSLAVVNIIVFQPGTPIKAADVNTNFANIKSAIESLQTTVFAFGSVLTGNLAGNPGLTINNTGDGAGIKGVSKSPTLRVPGVLGINNNTTAQSSGVVGQATASPIGTGVNGIGSITGGYFEATKGPSNGFNPVGVYANATGANSTGVIGKGRVTGGSFESSATVGVGVYGVANGTNSTGVVGKGKVTGGYFEATEAGGNALVVQAPGGGGSGYAIKAAGNVSQSPLTYGFMKAAAYVTNNNGTPQITRCFNSQATGAAVTAPPCGFSVTRSLSDYAINFGFNVGADFFSVTSASPIPLSKASAQLNIDGTSANTLFIKSDYVDCISSGCFAFPNPTDFFVVVF